MRTTSVNFYNAYNWQLSSSTTSEKYYPGYTGPIDVETCLVACRGHGFKWAALYYGTECYCASTFPNPQDPSSGSTISGPGTFPGASPGTKTVPSNCNAACNGNSSEICGGGAAASVYMDPSFTYSTSSISAASNYLYLGCYSNVNPGPMYAHLMTNSTVDCANYCGSLGYPYCSRFDVDTSTSQSCGCGTEIQTGLQISETSCSYYCNGSTNAL